MRRNSADDCMYMRHDGTNLFFIALYVDDLLISCSDMKTLENTKQKLSKKFRMKDLGESLVIIFMAFVRDRCNSTITLCHLR